MRWLKQSTAANVMVFMSSSTDHVTGATGLTLTITASKDGGAFGAVTPTVTERGNGWYNLALTTAHTNTLGDLAVHITATGADPTDLVCRVVAVDPADAVRMGLSALPNVSLAGTVTDTGPAAGSFKGNPGLSSTDGFYVGSVLAFTDGAVAGLARKITGYTGATRLLAFAQAFPQAPANGDGFVILGRID